MKTKLLFLLIAIPFIAFSQERNSKISYKYLDRDNMKTSILIEEFSPFSVLNNSSEVYGMFSLQNSYKELAKYDASNRFSQLEFLNKSMRLNTTNETIKIGGIHSNYETISADAVANNKVKIDEFGNVTRNSNDYIFELHNKTIITPLTINKKGLASTFYFDSNLFANTTTDVITSIKVNFDDNKGFVDLPFNTLIEVNYPYKGKKEITFKVTINENVIINKAVLNVKLSRKDNEQFRNANQQDIFSTIAPDLSIYPTTDGFAGMGEYEIFLSPDGILDKPIIVIDGFDPSDTRDIDGVYDLLTFTDSNNITQNLGDLIRNDEDFDVVILNFPQYLKLTDNNLLNVGDVTDTNGDMIIDENDYPAGSILIDGGADYIERNAMTLVTLIDQINNSPDKVGNEENVIIGPSMGGLISRYALTYMEQNNMDPETRLWISFDSPHYGANVPIGLQLLFNYFGYGYGDVDSVKLLVDGFLRSPAARQMLVDHFDAHMNPINSNTNDPVSPSTGLPYLPTGAPGYRDAFQARMDAVGFPTTTRNVSMINGSGLSAAFQDINGADVTPGFDLIDSNIDTGDVILFINTRADTFCEYMPSAGVQEKIVDVKIQAQIFFWITQDTFIADAQSDSFTDGVDSAPGGLFDIFALADSLGGDPVLTNFLAAMNTGFFSFIPTTSAMALSNQQDYYAVPNPNNGTPENETPFDAWYMPPTNEGHVVLTDANVNFALDEIIIRSDVSAKVFLQGATLDPNSGEETLMRDDLRIANLIPTTSPYVDALTVDPSILANTGNDAIVDWVWLELRDATDNTIVIANQSGLLQRDGDIVNTDGVSSIPFNNIPANNYYVAVKHRNHLGIISSTPIALSRITTNINFSDTNNPITFGTNAQTTFGMPTNILGMWAGNVNGDTIVQYSGTNPDTPNILSEVLNDSGNFLNLPTYIVNGYNVNDVNMDGNTQYTGISPDSPSVLENVLAHPDNFLNFSTYQIEEQLPEN